MKPLEGVTVLEFSTMITASFAAMMMAEQGARVIKVEPMNVGDPMRDTSVRIKVVSLRSSRTAIGVKNRFE